MSEAIKYVDVDKLLYSVGKLGRFQLRQFLVLLVAVWSCGFHLLAGVYIGYGPDSRCAAPKTDVNGTANASNSDVIVSRSYAKCRITTFTNTSEDLLVEHTECVNGYTYDLNKASSIVTEWDLFCGRSEYAELAQTLLMVGEGLGAVVFSTMADRFGRKPVHIGCNMLLLILGVTNAFVTNYIGFVIIRFLIGASLEGMGLGAAILYMEMFPTDIRATIEVFGGLLFWTTGVVFITPIAYVLRNHSWRYLQLALSAISLISLVEWWIIDESLRWLIANGRVKEAKAYIQRACRINGKNFNHVVSSSGFSDYEMAVQREQNSTETDAEEKLFPNDAEIPGTVQTERQTDGDKGAVERYTGVDIFKSRALLSVSAIMWVAWITNSLTYYGIMMISTSLAGNRYLNFFLGAVAEYPAVPLQYFMVKRYGRKNSAVVFHSMCCALLITATVLATTAHGNRSMMISSTVFTLLGKMAITASFSTIFLFTPELYPTNLRNSGLGTASLVARFGAVLAPFSSTLAERVVWAPGLIFGIMCAIVALLMLWVPETSRHELPQTLAECEVWYRENRFKLSHLKLFRFSKGHQSELPEV